jgi:3-keto-5-aminohexanoate cleavage enzyme
LPEQPPEIIEDAVECWKAGAAIIHLHARDASGAGTGDPEVFREINEGIRSRCPVVIQNTTGGPGIPVERRILSLDAGPEMASLNMGSVVFFSGDRGRREEVPFMNLRSEIESFARTMLDCGIKPELEVYNPSMFGEVANLIERGLLAEPCYINFVMNVGGMGGYPGTPRNLLTMVDGLPPDAVFNVSGVGSAQIAMSTMAILLGGHVRVGLEDNVLYRKGELAASNSQFVARVARIAGELGRQVATPKEAREILGIG